MWPPPNRGCDHQLYDAIIRVSVTTSQQFIVTIGRGYDLIHEPFFEINERAFSALEVVAVRVLEGREILAARFTNSVPNRNMLFLSAANFLNEKAGYASPSIRLAANDISWRLRNVGTGIRSSSRLDEPNSLSGKWTDSLYIVRKCFRNRTSEITWW